MGQAQINVRTRACSGTFIARTKQAALTHNVRGKRLRLFLIIRSKNSGANSNNNIIIESDIIITTVITINSILILSLL